VSASPDMTSKPQVSGQPQQLDCRTYAEVQEAAVSALVSCPVVGGVFLMGSVGQPGISDLDLIVVVAGDRPAVEIPDVRRAHPLAGYVMMHSPFLIDEATFHRIRYLAGVSQLQRLAGNVPMPATEEIPAVVRLHMAAKYALDALFSACRQRSLDTLRVRSTLCALNTMSHLLDLIRAEVEIPPTATALVEGIQHLRSTWFARPSVAQLWSLVSDAIPAYLAVLDVVGAASPVSACPDTRVLSWANMQVVATGKGAAGVSVVAPWPCWLPDHSPRKNRHLDDMRWSLRTCLVQVTPALGGLLCPGIGPQYPPALQERAELLQHYTGWLKIAPTWFGMLAPRVDAPEPVGAKWSAVAVARRLLA
jgi:hypothetical protein